MAHTETDTINVLSISGYGDLFAETKSSAPVRSTGSTTMHHRSGHTSFCRGHKRMMRR